MKKLISLLCVLSLVFALALAAGCDSDSKKKDDDKKAESSQTDTDTEKNKEDVKPNQPTVKPATKGAIDPEEAVKIYFYALVEGDAEAIMSVMLEQDYVDEETVNQTIEMFAEMDVKILKLETEVIDQTDDAEAIEALFAEYDYEIENATQIAEVEITESVEFEGEIEDDVTTMICVEIDGLWYVTFISE